MPGADRCIANLYITKKVLEESSKKAVKQVSNEVLRESNIIIPRKTGFMMRSGYVFNIKDTPTEFFMRVGYTAPYAMRQHEMPYHHEVGQWKFLSTAFNKTMPKLITAVEGAWRSVL